MSQPTPTSNTPPHPHPHPHPPPCSLRVALVQMRSGIDIQANIADACARIAEAAAGGAQMVLTPEATNIVQRDADALRKVAPAANGDPAMAKLSQAARQNGVWLLAGSLMQRPQAGAEEGGKHHPTSQPDHRVVNRAHMFAPTGEAIAHYDKIHLFDVTVSDDERYHESQSVAPGQRGCVVQTPWGGLGLSICYDVRFSHFYRDMAKAGAVMLAVPAAFTRHTGRAHWEVLLRARAIETGCFVLAPAQGGRHADGRATWGHSMVIDPWGEVIAHLDHDDPGLVFCDLDLSKIAAIRGKIPSLQHDRDYALTYVEHDAAPPNEPMDIQAGQP